MAYVFDTNLYICRDPIIDICYCVASHELSVYSFTQNLCACKFHHDLLYLIHGTIYTDLFRIYHVLEINFTVCDSLTDNPAYPTRTNFLIEAIIASALAIL